MATVREMRLADFDTFILVKNNETIATACQIYVVGINCDTVGTTLHLTSIESSTVPSTSNIAPRIAFPPIHFYYTQFWATFQ